MRSKLIRHPLAAVFRVAREAPTFPVDPKIHHFQEDLPKQARRAIRHFRDFEEAVPTIDSYPDIRSMMAGSVMARFN